MIRKILIKHNNQKQKTEIEDTTKICPFGAQNYFHEIFTHRKTKLVERKYETEI